MNKKYWFIFCTLLLISIIFLACKSQNEYNQPEIEAILTISKLTEKDFESVGTNSEGKEDFRKVYFLLEVNNCSNISNRKITFPDFKEVMNTYDIERYWYGQYTTSDSPGIDAFYSNDIMFLSKGLTDEDIKSLFKDTKISITWEDNKGKEVNRNINLADIIEFK